MVRSKAANEIQETVNRLKNIKNRLNENYPPGAEHDPNAPWNQNDPEFEGEFTLEIDGQLVINLRDSHNGHAIIYSEQFDPAYYEKTGSADFSNYLQGVEDEAKRNPNILNDKKVHEQIDEIIDWYMAVGGVINWEYDEPDYPDEDLDQQSYKYRKENPNESEVNEAGVRDSSDAKAIEAILQIIRNNKSPERKLEGIEQVLNTIYDGVIYNGQKN